MKYTWSWVVVDTGGEIMAGPGVVVSGSGKIMAGFGWSWEVVDGLGWSHEFVMAVVTLPN